MKYLATIKLGTDSWSQLFDTENDAKKWLDANNINAEHTTIINEIDEKGIFVNSIVYTKGAE